MREVSFRGDGFELPLLQSPLLERGFRHGFTTRRGGVSAAPVDTLNLGGRWGDLPERVVENRRRLEHVAGRPIFFATQVHGAAAAAVAPGMTPQQMARLQADAVIASGPGAAVGVYVADCVPVLIGDVRTGACAAVHAGWRGTVAGVVGVTLRQLIAGGGRVEDLRVAVGPSIGPCCFEVGPEVVAAVATIGEEPIAFATGASLGHVHGLGRHSHPLGRQARQAPQVDMRAR